MSRKAEYPLWADTVLNLLIDMHGVKHISVRYVTRHTSLDARQVQRAIQHLRRSGIAVMESQGRYWLSEDALQQLWYASKRARDMVARAETTLGAVQKQEDRHIDKRFLAPLRRRFAFIRDELEEVIPAIRDEIAKRNHKAG